MMHDDRGDDDDGDEGDEGSLLDALRTFGREGVTGATYNPLARARPGLAAQPAAEPTLGEDNYDILRRARGEGQEHHIKHEGRTEYAELKRQHQVDLNDAKQLNDLEDPGLRAHMDQARSRLAEHRRNQEALPSVEELRRYDTEARRALSGLMTGLKAQQMALQVASEDVLLQAANARKLAAGSQPHGYPEAGLGVGPAAHAAKNLAHLGKKTEAAGEDLARVTAALEGFERELTLARRAYEAAADGQARRSRYFEDTVRHFEEAYGQS